MINVGVIGCGYWRPNLVRNLIILNHMDMETPNSSVVAVSDLHKETLDQIRTLSGNQDKQRSSLNFH
jgi:hypothetical protein